ncbi:MAG: hypothetical protein JWM53_4395 [bacterium]|nr:hypothetical protein [bacterium]
MAASPASERAAAFVLVTIALALGGDACSQRQCATFFGSPTDDTGLDDTQCRPSCGCGDGAFTPPAYDDAFVQSLVDDWVPSAPLPPLTSDPYAAPLPPDDPPGTVCAVLPGDASARPRPYQLVTYGSIGEALAAGAHPTHFGSCGVCSTLTNLAVYMRYVDLGKPVRACASANDDVACLQGLGFELPCAQIWAYNTTNTRNQCLEVCLDNFTSTYNQPDGSLNPCLQCDEDRSGPVFKAIAGRTRRNSGLPNAICRPCGEVQPLVHAY